MNIINRRTSINEKCQFNITWYMIVGNDWPATVAFSTSPRLSSVLFVYLVTV